ncbi:hypothetical protein BDQ17DRAFT_1326113 [Cyathus striatus]|nr:hypothetical protein BDQ17DRAFT_1326113 [Cyathus striatus]
MFMNIDSCSAFLVAIPLLLLIRVPRRRMVTVVLGAGSSIPRRQLLHPESHSMLEETMILVVDAKAPMGGGTVRFSEHSTRALSDLKNPKGNALQVGNACDPGEKLFIALRTAQLVLALHSLGVIHGNLFPGVFGIEEGYITLFDTNLYAAAQKMLECIHMGPSHRYKAKAELKQHTFSPSMAADVHSWAKTVIAIYNGFCPILSFAERSPLPAKPQKMPVALWNVIEKCLSENLIGVPSIEDIVAELNAVIPML